ncbi:esterase [Edwardsiella piscicida]|uniref:esterase n=1 Tax=Edwardsiella piscicida TaxID=1263550 RepID=UPI00084BD3C6|nr:esterase [Edwardsiella piscicida]EKS7766861.1 esterase [Edwardsiella piscicida]EKS7813490.1 esterase [Edwardsiella piscicida]UCQ21449.1 esterase [Edwardsiella piscicida]WAM45032.1 esterase [Edwardsiella piscicida]
MVEMFEQTVGGIPLLHAVPAGQRDSALPTIFFYHGFTSSKEMYSYFGYAFAAAGFRVLLPEADMHGSRYDGDERRRLAHFWDILKSNIDELPSLYDHFLRAGLILDGRVGVAGASLGGMTALGAKARYPWLRATASFMGSGFYLSLSQRLFPRQHQPTEDERAWVRQRVSALADYDVSGRLAQLADRPLLIWHGLADDLVPAAESQRLAQALASQHLMDNVSVVTEPGIAHKITASALDCGTVFFSRCL